MEHRTISSAVIRRLPRYYRYLGELRESGVKRISSRELSERMKVTASQIRQDLNNFGGFGQQGYGYNVDTLFHEIAAILGIDHEHNVIIIGAGNLGQALVNSGDFAKRGFNIIAIFDNNAELAGKKVGNIKISMISQMADFIKKNNVDIVAITVPRQAANEVAKIAIDAGARGIWNFAHTDISVPEDVVVENVHLSESIMRLSYKLKEKK